MQRCQQQFDDISAEIKREMERFELTRVKDFKVNIIKYIEDQMAHQQQVRTHICAYTGPGGLMNAPFFSFFFQIVSYWEAFAPFAREIV